MLATEILVDESDTETHCVKRTMEIVSLGSPSHPAHDGRSEAPSPNLSGLYQAEGQFPVGFLCLSFYSGLSLQRHVYSKHPRR